MTSQRDTDPVWLERMTYPWRDGTDPTPWFVTIDWVSDSAGNVLPARLELTSAQVDWSQMDDTDLRGQTLVPLSREVTKRLPLAHFIELSRRAMLAAHADHDAECCEVVAAQDSPPQDEYDALLRRAAQTYNHEVHHNRSPHPAKATADALRKAGVTTLRGGQVLTDQRVRTWLTDARKRGYVLPSPRPAQPADKPSRSHRGAGTKSPTKGTNNRTEKRS